MDALTKTQILSANDIKTVEIDVPEWGVTVYVREWSGVERTKAMQQFRQEEDAQPSAEVMARILCGVLRDEDGRLIFDDTDAPALANKSGAVLDRLFMRAMEINGIGRKAEEDAVKN